MSEAHRRAEVAERAARAGAEVAAASFRDGIPVRTKDGTADVVTEADHAAQARVVEVVEDAFPGDTVVGEEEGLPDEVPGAGPAWVVDPIDGTNNFVRDLGLWATSVAAVEDGEPVAGANVLPVLSEAYVSGPDGTSRDGEPVTVNDRDDPETFTVGVFSVWGSAGTRHLPPVLDEADPRFYDLRRLGSAQYTLSLVASGTLDAAIGGDLAGPWDTLAGVHMVRRAGGVVTGRAGDRWTLDSGEVVASNGEAHDAVLAAVRR